MSSYKDLFPGGLEIPSRAPALSSAGEISLRDEMTSFLLGTDGEIPKGQKFLLRRMRRDDDDNLTQCYCVDEVTKEPDLDYRCPSCLGCGYLWDEELVVGYKSVLSSISTSRAFNLDKTEFGVLSLPAIVFYFAYLTAPTIKDKIIEIELDLEGDPVIPYNRVASYEINLLRDLRSDRGRVEYWACYSSSENITTEAS